VQAAAVIFGIVLLAITGWWTFAYFRRRWRRG
jgi:hypothetical protein